MKIFISGDASHDYTNFSAAASSKVIKKTVASLKRLRKHLHFVVDQCGEYVSPSVVFDLLQSVLYSSCRVQFIYLQIFQCLSRGTKANRIWVNENLGFVFPQ